MKEKILRFAAWSRANWESLITIAAVILLGFTSLILISWLAGFWLSALFGMRFELNSCWQGLGAVITGLCSIGTAGGLMAARHYIDSRYNSPAEQPPENAKKQP